LAKKKKKLKNIKRVTGSTTQSFAVMVIASRQKRLGHHATVTMGYNCIASTIALSNGGI
jgi:hypothetical protein